MKTLKHISILFLLMASFGCTDSEFAAVDGPSTEESIFSNFATVIDQAAEEKIVDLLIVVDNSTSMSTDQEKLSREFASFVSLISDADYRIGVVTTDTDTVGKENEEGFYGNLAVVEATGKRYIEKSDADPTSLFANLIKREESISCRNKTGCVSFNERPLYAIKMAIDKRETVNRGFFREGADLAVVIITDEDEFVENDGSYYSAQNLLDYFKSEFGENKKLTAFDIAIPEGDQACYESQAAETNSGTAVSYGIRVGELRSLTGGFPVNICNQNFSAELGDISTYVAKNLLPLRVKVPEGILEKSIEIRVITPEGQLFPVTHAIEDGKLEISPLPPEGSRIELKYRYEL